LRYHTHPSCCVVHDNVCAGENLSRCWRGDDRSYVGDRRRIVGHEE
jgi:hypothetical protein